MNEQMLESVRRELDREEDDLGFFQGAMYGCLLELVAFLAVGLILLIVRFL